MKENFEKILVYLRTLAIYYKTAHWQSHGPLYYGDHLLFDRLSKNVEEEIDGVAEKAIGLTQDVSVVNPVNHLKHVIEVLEIMPTEVEHNSEFVHTALQFEKRFLSFLEEISKEGSAGFQNMVGDLADKHEGNVYLLNQRSPK